MLYENIFYFKSTHEYTCTCTQLMIHLLERPTSTTQNFVDSQTHNLTQLHPQYFSCVFFKQKSMHYDLVCNLGSRAKADEKTFIIHHSAIRKVYPTTLAA